MIPQEWESGSWCFDDLCLYIYCIVDDLLTELRQLRSDLKRPGPMPRCTDSELIAMTLIGECMGWDCECTLLRHMAAYANLFPRQPGQSRFNRRRRLLAEVTNLIRQRLLEGMDLAQDRDCLLDSIPVPVVSFHLVPHSRASAAGVEWSAHEAAFGYCASRKQHLYGYKLQLLTSSAGLILDYELAPANYTDLDVGSELLEGYQDLVVIADKGYISEPVADDLWRYHGIRLLTPKRRNQHVQLSPVLTHLLKRMRQIIETVNAQLNAQFHIETNLAHTFGGLRARLHSKLTAHTLCIFINRLIGNPNFLQIKQLAVPHTN